MTTRKGSASKSTPASAKKTPTGKKTSAQPLNSNSADSAVTPKFTKTPHSFIGKGKRAKNIESTTTPDPSPLSKAEAVGITDKESTDIVLETPPENAASASQLAGRIVGSAGVKKKTPTSRKLVQDSTNVEEIGETRVEEPSNKEIGDAKQEEIYPAKIEESSKSSGVLMKEQNAGELAKKEGDVDEVHHFSVEHVGDLEKQDDPVITDLVKSSEVQAPYVGEKASVQEIEADELAAEEMECGNKKIKMNEDVNKDVEYHGGGICDKEEHTERSITEKKVDGEHLLESNFPKRCEGAALEEDCAELNAAAKERRKKKEVEIFVGGLDRDAVEDDVRKVFEYVGEVVEVRMHKDSLTSKNKGYAFVTFATRDQASRALLEMKNPVIHGKRCGTAPSEDNDTLFLGNICNTWTKEAVKQKLKDYGIEGVENVTLVQDAQHEGLSRGFAFVEFSCHIDAMAAYKRLQKPDVIFGHPERTAKVAFAEPLQEPDPEVMALVKSVFVDGLPPHWDEDHVREKFKIFGEIERITLARNMPSSRRKDFGFVDFATHEAAVACIDGINDTEQVDGNSKVKLKARLSNPLPKTQAVKGGMSGGFRIGRGRGFVRGRPPFSRAQFQRGRGFYQHGHGQYGRNDFADEYSIEGPYSPSTGMQQDARWDYLEGASGGGFMDHELGFDRQRYRGYGRGRGTYVPFRQQHFPPGGRYNRPFFDRHFDDPCFYDDARHGIKRPHFMMDQDPGYMEPRGHRPRFAYFDRMVPVRGTEFLESFEPGGVPSYEFYGSDYGGDRHQSFYGDHRYGGGHYL